MFTGYVDHAGNDNIFYLPNSETYVLKFYLQRSTKMHCDVGRVELYFKRPNTRNFIAIMVGRAYRGLSSLITLLLLAAL
jgi:hypothetical protein